MPEIIIIQGSLHKQSRTSIVVKETENVLTEKKISFQTIDLRKLELQFCDGRPLNEYNHDMQEVHKQLEKAHGFIIAMPVYQYSLSGVLKNFLDIHSKPFGNKCFGIICNSGGKGSYLASADLIKLLSFEVHSIPIQPTIHTWAGDFDKERTKITNEGIIPRISEMVDHLISHVRARKS